MAGPGCTFAPGCENIKTQPLNNPNRGKVDIRVVAVDERLGIAWLRMEWGTRNDMRLAVWEAFKIHDGRIHAVEAFMKVIPPGTGSGWPATTSPAGQRPLVERPAEVRPAVDAPVVDEARLAHQRTERGQAAHVAHQRLP